MTNEKKPDQLEIEKIKLERLKVYGKIITVLISISIGTFGVAYINNNLQNKKLEGQMRMEEMENLGKFLDYALKKDVTERIRFADYFAKLTISDKVRGRWGEYLKGLKALQTDEEKSKEKLEAAQKAGDSEKVKKLEIELAKLKAQTAPLPKEDEYLTNEKAERLYLDKDWKPRIYTENKFDVKTINDDKVVVDHATGLTWQQSGSKEFMTYDEARRYIAQLNRGKFAGYSNWRLPTLKEAITLLEQEKNSDRLFIGSEFDNKQGWIWTSDLYSASSAWVVTFGIGSCGYYDFYGNSYVRAVR